MSVATYNEEYKLYRFSPGKSPMNKKPEGGEILFSGLLRYVHLNVKLNNNNNNKLMDSNRKV
jgi:hypothetical protein